MAIGSNNVADGKDNYSRRINFDLKGFEAFHLLTDEQRSHIERHIDTDINVKDPEAVSAWVGRQKSQERPCDTCRAIGKIIKAW